MVYLLLRYVLLAFTLRLLRRKIEHKTNKQSPAVPLIPYSLKPWHEVSCHICRFHQDLKYRPDVQQQMDGGGGNNIPMQAPPQNQGWGGGQPGHGHPAYK